jgi:hypothetical protein
MSRFWTQYILRCSERPKLSCVPTLFPGHALRKLTMRILAAAIAWLLALGVATAGPMMLNGISENYTFTNNSGMVANDLELTFNQKISKASNAFPPFANPPELSKDKKKITFSGGTVNKKGSVKAVVNFPNGKKVELKKAEWSFPNKNKKPVPNVAIGAADIKLGMINNGTGGALVSLTTGESSSDVYFTGFALAKNVPGSLFIDTPSQLEALTVNNMYFADGTPVTTDAVSGALVPSSFELTPGEQVVFHLGAVNPQDYIELTYTADFTSTPSVFAVQVTDAASPIPTPEPASLVLLGMGSLGLIGYAWRRRKRSD